MINVRAEESRAMWHEGVISMATEMEASRAMGAQSLLKQALINITDNIMINVRAEESRAMWHERMISNATEMEVSRAMGAEASIANVGRFTNDWH